MLNINIFGGPGTGKSITASSLFSKMKLEGHSVEFVTEYAKDLTYGGYETGLKDQVHMLGEQYHRYFRAKDHVDFLIHDSPFLMSIAYTDPATVPVEEFSELVLALHRQQNNLNVFLTRSDHEYEENGRNQCLSEAIQKDVEIKGILEDNDVKFYEIPMGKKAHKKIYKLLNKTLKEGKND